jgi:cell division protein FtsW (lipid II flippase)/cell division protein FtsI/penicillin-binding protein 2
MAVTRTWEHHAALKLEFLPRSQAPERRREFWVLLGASILVSLGLLQVFVAKTQDFPSLRSKLALHELLDLNAPLTPEQVLPVLSTIGDVTIRQQAADNVTSYVERHRPLPNVGALAHLRLAQTRFPLAKVKAQMVVRTPEEFSKTFALWAVLYLSAFWLVHFAWRGLRFRGDWAILPALHLLTGIGLITMVSLRDPLRDNLEFKKFALGVMLGCAILLLPLFRAFQYRHLERWTYVPLFAAIALFVALAFFGSGPTGSDAKVNLGPFQPVELIKILVVLFLAGYFSGKWEWLRDLREKRLVPRWLAWPDFPRFGHILPAMIGVSCALFLFFALKDMGPALVVGFVFIAMFALARGRAGLPILAVILLVAGVTVGYRLGSPHTVVERVAMWLSPWDNNVRGGDQLAHSLWAFATGGPWGSGPGWGDPEVIPAGHTDLILPAIGEEWGFAGVAAVFILFVFLVGRAFRIALYAVEEYAVFLAFGLGALVALEMLLISGGALGAIPLSGVVSPFLSSGNTAMLANFLIFAILLSISNQSARAVAGDRVIDWKPLFRLPAIAVSVALLVCATALVIRGAQVQVLEDNELLSRDAHVITQDGVKRPQHNPRLNLLAASIPRGNIYDRNGVLLATSSWDDLEKQRKQYAQLGVSLDTCCSHTEARHYPFGAATVHLLGDLRTRANFEASNASLIEADSSPRLRGYKDFGELAPVVRYRHQRDNPTLQKLLNRDRDVHSTIDIRLQLKAFDILKSRLEATGKKGALVVLSPATGDLLTAVSWPSPSGSATPTPDELLDRARYGQYPPGSTFKLVTAMAALRLDPRATEARFGCHPLGDGRVGTIIPGWRRPIRDDVGDHAHGTLNLQSAIALSCNAYFAQLGVFKVGTKELVETAQSLGISPGAAAEVKKMLPFAAYGQGPVVATPFKMARVAATVAAGGSMPEGRWVSDTSNDRTAGPVPVLAPESADFLARSMRSVVTAGTARAALAGLDLPVAGKTGTAQVDVGEPHSWFAGFAPYGEPAARAIAFAVVVEHGGYGAKIAAPIGREIAQAAQQLGIIGQPAEGGTGK